jgi:hypothetical protein
MAYKKPHDLKKSPVSVGDPGFPIDGIVSINAARNEDEFSTSNGLNGARQVKNNNVTGIVTMVVSQHSTSHAALKALYISNVSFPIKCVDKTTDLTFPAGFFADECRFAVPPPFNRESEQTDIEYRFTAVSIEPSQGSPADA